MQDNQIQPVVNSQEVETRDSSAENLSMDEIEKILDDMRLDSAFLQSNPDNGHERSLPDKSDPHSEQQQQETNDVVDELTTSDISININKVEFGRIPLFPGTIQEVDLSISLNHRENQQEQQQVSEITHILRVIAVCKNQQFNALDEYVFSVRSNNYYEYYEQVRFKIKRGERADLKVAVKIPPVLQNCDVNGVLQIRLQNLQPIYVPILAKVVLPDITCLKTLFNEQQQTSMLRVPARKGQARTPPLPFRNNTPFPLTLEIETLTSDNNPNKPYDIITQNYVTCQPNSQFFINMQLKQNLNYNGVFPTKMMIRKVLLIRIKNTSSYLHFPMEVCIFEGMGVEGN